MQKKINVTCSSMPDFFEYCEEIKDIWDSRWLTNMGPKHTKLQTELATYLNVPNVTLYTNGHLALEYALELFQFPRGSEVITTPFTFVSTTNSIVRCGLEPVFCDINPVDYTLDANKLESLISDKTVAIMPVHVYGNVCNVEKIEEIAAKYSLKVIYDAAHAFGVTYKGKSVAQFGDLSMFSFHATKVFNTIEGGALCYHNSSYTQQLNDRKNFGIHGQDKVEYIGGNAKMNEFQAAMGLCNLRYIDAEIAKRKAAVLCYMDRLKDTDGLQLNPVQDGVISNYAYFPVVFDAQYFGASRDEIKDVLAEHGIVARKYFYPLTNSIDCFHGKYIPQETTPEALRISNSVLTLPLYADIPIDIVNRICDIILSCKK